MDPLSLTKKNNNKKNPPPLVKLSASAHVGDEWYGVVHGQNLSIFNIGTALVNLSWKNGLWHVIPLPFMISE